MNLLSVCRWLLAGLLPCFLFSVPAAAVRLPAMFGSHMVLQAGMPVPVWGWAERGESVEVRFGSTRVQTLTGSDGRWRVELPPLAPGLRGTLIVQGRERVELTDVITGEVWLCSGQSNMTFRLEQTANAKQDVADANQPLVRLFTVARAVAEEGPQSDVKGRWVVCTPTEAAKFSAVGYFMGRRLHETLGVPVGLIHSSWGGTRAEAWTPRATLERDPELRPILERWAQESADFPTKQREFEARLPELRAIWEQAAADAKAAGRMPPAEPRLRTGPNTQYAPCGLYNAMIAPLAGFALRGVAWYQGEANATRAEQYRTLFPAMIGAWREAWGRALPFVYVQLPNLAREPEPSQSGWAELREAQALTLALPHTAMAVTIDVGDPGDLHPTTKAPVGLRVALAAESVAYQLSSDDRLSPVYQRARFEDGGRVRLFFAPGRGPLASRAGAELAGFVIAGEDRDFRPARAVIDRDTVLVWHDDVSRPLAVRYAWADNPIEANLVNAAGLPASPFRTDDWPEVTTGRR